MLAILVWRRMKIPGQQRMVAVHAQKFYETKDTALITSKIKTGNTEDVVAPAVEVRGEENVIMCAQLVKRLVIEAAVTTKTKKPVV